jgi:uncharacterized protein YggE
MVASIKDATMHSANIAGSFVRCLIAAALLSPALLYSQLGQITASSVTVTATQSATAQPSQALFLVTVYSLLSTSLADAAASVSSVGITPSNLSNVQSVPLPNASSPQPLAWTFQLIAPFSSQKTIATALAGLQNSISQNNSGLALSFSVSSYGDSVASCSLSSLVTNARSQAQALAAAAGQPLGAIVGLTSTVSNIGLIPCSITVKFALGLQIWESAPTITISASQSAGPQPDQAIVSVAVYSGLAMGLDDVTGALQSVGITGATLVAIETTTTYTGTGNSQPSLVWLFDLPTPISSLGSVLAHLTTAGQAFQKQNSTLSVTFSVGGVLPSQPVSCAAPALLAQAQSQAQLVAAAAGAQVGAVLNLVTANNALVIDGGDIIAQSGELGGGISPFLLTRKTSTSSPTTSSTTFAVAAPSATPVCTMNAQFQLQ